MTLAALIGMIGLAAVLAGGLVWAARAAVQSTRSMAEARVEAAQLRADLATAVEAQRVTAEEMKDHEARFRAIIERRVEDDSHTGDPARELLGALGASQRAAQSRADEARRALDTAAAAAAAGPGAGGVLGEPSDPVLQGRG